MEKLLMIIVLISLCITAPAQDSTTAHPPSEAATSNRSDSLQSGVIVFNQADLSIKHYHPFYFTFEAGTSVATNFNGGFATNLYLAPQIGYRPDARWQFNAAPFIGRGAIYDMPLWIGPGLSLKADGTYTQLGIYAQGLYNISEKLYVGSSVWGQSMLFDQSFRSPDLPDLKNIGSSAFVGYKFSDNFSVEAGFGINRNPYSNINYMGSPMGPYGNPGFRNPYNRF